MAVSFRVLSATQVTGTTLPAGTSTPVALTNATSVQADEWVCCIVFGGAQGSYSGGIFIPFSNVEAEAYLTHPSFQATVSVPFSSGNVTMNGISAEGTPIWAIDTPALMMTTLGAVVGVVPAGETFTLYWTNPFSIPAVQADYLAVLAAVKTSPNQILNPFGSGYAAINNDPSKPSPPHNASIPIPLTDVQVSMTGPTHRVAGNPYLLLGAVTWNGTPPVTINSGWTVATTQAWGTTINGAVVSQEINDLNTYIFDASWSSTVAGASIQGLQIAQTPGSSGLHVWHPV